MAKITALIENGAHGSYVAAETGCTPSTIQHYAKRWRARGFLKRRLFLDTRDLKIWQPKIAAIPLATCWPYVNTRPTTEHDLMLLIDRVVPKSLPEWIRADVCQQILLDILEGHLTPETLAQNMPDIVRLVRREIRPWKEQSFESLAAAGDSRHYLETHAAEPAETIGADTWHDSFACRICWRRVTVGTVNDHDTCLVIEEEQFRHGPRYARASATHRPVPQSPLLHLVKKMADPSFRVEFELYDTRARVLRTTAAVADCCVCGFPLPVSHGADYHDACAEEWRERQYRSDATREKMQFFHRKQPHPGRSRAPHVKAPVSGACGNE